MVFIYLFIFFFMMVFKYPLIIYKISLINNNIIFILCFGHENFDFEIRTYKTLQNFNISVKMHWDEKG